MTHDAAKIAGRYSALLLIGALLAACGNSESERLRLLPPWAYATPFGANVAAVYMEITVAEADTLMSASTPFADKIEMHSSSEENGMMKMRPMERVPLEAGKPFSFAPGGAHLMLIGLRQPLVAGMQFPLTLQLDRGGTHSTQVRVVAIGSPPPPPY